MFKGFWEELKRCLRGFGSCFLEVIGRHMGGFGRCLGCVWKVCRRCLRGYWRCLGGFCKF